MSNPKPQFPLVYTNRREKFPQESLRYALVLREALHNAESYGASKVLVFFAQHKGKDYLMIGHNGKPFKSKSEMEEACKIGMSAGNGGIQGSGMKASMFLMSPSEKAELILYSKTGNGHALSVRCENENEMAICDKSLDWVPFLKTILSSQKTMDSLTFKDINVLYGYRTTDRNSDEERQATITRYLRLAAEMCKQVCEKIKIHAYLNKAFSEIRTIDDYNRSAFALSSQSEFDADYLGDQAEFLVEKVKIVQQSDPYDASTKKELYFDAVIRIKVYPNLTGQYGRLVRLHKNEMGNMDLNSKESLFVSCRFKVNSNKDFRRASEDNYFCSVHAYDKLGIIGLHCPKNVNFSSKISQFYPDLTSATNWCPITKVEVELLPHEGVTRSDVGNLNEFFYIDETEKINDVLTQIFEKLNDENPPDLQQFRKLVREKHYPYDEISRVPLPKLISDGMQTLVDVYSVSDSEHPLREVAPPFTSLVRLRVRGSNEYLQGDIHCMSKGITVYYTGQNNLYALTVSPLSKFNDETGQYDIVISTEDYRHDKSCAPEKYIFVSKGPNRYKLSCYVDIPERQREKGTSNGGPTSPAGIQKRQEEETSDNYQPMGYAELFGRFERGILQLNTDNPTINLLTQFNHLERKDLYRRFVELYEEATRTAGQASEDLTYISETHYKNSCTKDMEERFGKSYDFLINTYLAIVFRSERAERLKSDLKQIALEEENPSGPKIIQMAG